MEIRGFLERIKGDVVSGWAYDFDSPADVVNVTILVEGFEAATAAADHYRSDVKNAGHVNSTCGFIIQIPQFFMRPGSKVSAYVGLYRIEVLNGPILIPQLEIKNETDLKSETPPVEAEIQKRFTQGLSAWGQSAFLALPDFINHALSPKSGIYPIIGPVETISSMVKQVVAKYEQIELTFLRDPDCSIIIPVFNQFEITYQCIKSIKDTGADKRAEIIIADDVSTDAICLLSGLFPNIRISRTRSNVGFILNCNHAARLARAPIILFLNNDTLVQNGWLDSILDTFSEFEKVGVVGSKLLFDDGILQDAGGILWSDGSAWNYGRGEDANAPEYSYVREVDYVTGASLAIKRSLFDYLGGFDPIYVPAYCEDSDICLKASSAGYRVLYQPFSQVVHLEGKSHGTDDKIGVKTFQISNTRRLHTIWRSYIEGNGENGVKPWKNKDRRSVGRALVLDLVTPTPDRDAGSIATYEQMLILRDLGYKISFIPVDNFAHVGEPTRRLQAAGIECVYGPYVQSVDEWLEKFGSDLDLVHVYRPDVLNKYLRVIKSRVPNARIIYSNADMHSLRMEREALITNNDNLLAQASRMREIELYLHKEVEMSIVTSDHEVGFLKEHVRNAPVELLRWITDVKELYPTRVGRDAIVFLGGYQHTPNVDAVDYIIREILPSIQTLCPEVCFLICGSSMPERFHTYAGPNVEVIGFVDDLQEMFRRCIASIAPIRFGAGFKGKVATSLSYGVPCIGSPIAFEGMGIDDGEGVIAAVDPYQYATAIAELYKNQATWEHLSAAAISAINRLYSRDHAMSVWERILRSMDCRVKNDHSQIRNLAASRKEI